MREIIITSDYVSFDSGLIKLTPEQYSKREHALKKTKETDVYEITGRTGFRRGEVVSYDGDIDQLVKAGMVSAESVCSDEDKEPDEEMSAILAELNSQKDKNLFGMAKSLGIDSGNKSREALIKEIADECYLGLKKDKILAFLEALSDEELVNKAGEVGILPGDLARFDLIVAIAEKISEAGN